MAHLDRDRLEGARDHRGGDRVDASGRGSAHLPRIRLPEASARAVQPGGTTVVVSRWKTTAGALECLADRQQRALVVARWVRGEAPVPPKDTLALAEQWVAAGRAHGQLLDARPLPDRRHAQVDDLDRVAERVAVLLLVEAVELLERLAS